MTLEIKNVNDLNIKNLKQWRYSIVNFEITHSNPTTIKISFALQDRVTKKVSETKTIDINGFKIPSNIHEVFQNISINLKNNNYTKKDGEKTKNDLLKALQTTRIFYKTFMFSNLPDVDYLPLQLRTDFDNLRKETEKNVRQSFINFTKNQYSNWKIKRRKK